MKIEEYLQWKRMKKGQLADKAGVHRTTLSRIIHGKHSPSWRTCYNIGAATGGHVTAEEVAAAYINGGVEKMEWTNSPKGSSLSAAEFTIVKDLRANYYVVKGPTGLVLNSKAGNYSWVSVPAPQPISVPQSTVDDIGEGNAAQQLEQIAYPHMSSYPKGRS